MRTTDPPTREQIEELAYLYWEARGCSHGEDLEDWLRAERELTEVCGYEEPPSPDLPD